MGPLEFGALEREIFAGLCDGCSYGSCALRDLPTAGDSCEAARARLAEGWA